MRPATGSPATFFVCLLLIFLGVGVPRAWGQNLTVTSGTGNYEAVLSPVQHVNFLFGFSSSSGNNGQYAGDNPTGFEDVAPTVTSVPGTSDSLITYNATATSVTGGASATASLSMEWGPTPQGLGLFNINASVSQSRTRMGSRSGPASAVGLSLHIEPIDPYP
jgi:hypothetical protein